ncbi:MAG: hypothetical protein A2W91_04170 [Bacteroidetes bacterium GWF2_38_335]|nr:MAG: hypothetical protein A2W91_04170 [Bacteroidetes bacterium GWF2_38_335]OFY79146.1 MAG: hypothetical protein A2281_03505 [Bacteroidetes bacterium RIFOXYA12_FULL_38_20]HBS88766.1 hypothetical protein [Bacteroidales bacterium]
MSKKIIIISIILLFAQSLFSQDLIVTNAGDSLKCKITKVTKENIYFNIWSDNQLNQSIISKQQVKNYFLGAYSPDNTVKKTKQDYSKQSYKFSYYNGMSRLTNKIDETMDPLQQQYEKNLQTGNHFGLEAGYFVKEGTGVGLSLCKLKTKNEMRNQLFENSDGDTVIGSISDDVTILFVGPTIFNRIYSKNRLTMYFIDLSLGYLKYSNNFKFLYSYSATGNTLGFSTSFGVNFLTGEHFALSISSKIILGTLKELTISNGSIQQTYSLDRSDQINLARIDLSFGVNFYY